MGRVAKIGPTDRSYPAEFDEGTRRANQARAEVAHQITEQLMGGTAYYEAEANEVTAAEDSHTSPTLTGSLELVAHRTRQLADAKRHGDQFVIRAALMDLTVAAAATVVDIDLRILSPNVAVVRGPDIG